MELPEFEVLEAKITRVLERVETLKQENEELRRSLDALRAEYNEKAARLEEIELELAQAKSERQDVEKVETIRRKVSGLLDKLDKV
ncbi:MAG TPA: hypothetical protein ENI92_00445 [Bacteroidetes bacterium]|nr:hypothetical protein [Bacteroidota bacterium]